MTNISKVLLERAKKVNNAEELIALAKENNIELTVEQAKAYYTQFNTKITEFSDEELSNVAGGADFAGGKDDRISGGCS